MTQLGEAVARYHKLLESEPYKDLSWAHALHERMKTQNLAVSGRPISPFLRPHFITRRQHTSLVKAAESLLSAIDRVKQMALANPALLARMELLPAEKMLAAIDPGYPYLAVTGLLDTHLNNGTVRFVEYNADAPTGVVYGEALSDMFYDCGPVKEFRKRYSLSKLGGSKQMLHALVKAYKEYGGKKKPQIAIVEFRQPFTTAESGEYLLMAEMFRREGYSTEIVSPEQLEYRAGVLRKGDFVIDLVYRRVKVQEFLIRYDLNHALVRAYRDHNVCVVNSFRSELAHKKAIFDLLTDEALTASFPLVERKAIKEFIPWTRVVTQAQTTYNNETVDLPEFILQNREQLVLKPNDESADQHAVRGWETDSNGWERALKTALRNPYVVQEKVAPVTSTFPLLQWGHLEMREMRVDVHPHAYLGKVHGVSSWVSTLDNRFSTAAGLAATFILDVK